MAARHSSCRDLNRAGPERISRAIHELILVVLFTLEVDSELPVNEVRHGSTVSSAGFRSH